WNHREPTPGAFDYQVVSFGRHSSEQGIFNSHAIDVDKERHNSNPLPKTPADQNVTDTYSKEIFG
ncbi:MAG: hypothetical protein DMG08_14910, partial [Acidobacteria bacterium]